MNDTSAQKAPPQEIIYARIWSAIAERKLRPGTQLKEEQLAELFSVSRARVRQALAALERDGLVTIFRNRGAFVSEPSIEEARDVFFARRMIEARLVERLSAAPSGDAIDRLRKHLELEKAAHLAQDRKAIIHLSGEFHLLIAELAGSRYLWQVLRDLISRTSLITAVYQSHDTTSCGPDEHGLIVEAIANGDAAHANRLMDHHLEHIEAALDLREEKTRSTDLRDILT